MKVAASVKVNGSKEAIWKVISDIENSVNTISGIVNVQIIDPPGENLVGLKWKETRIMFGKEAVETMWITHGQENVYYQTRAESHGAIYLSRMAIEEEDDHCVLTMSFKSEGVGFFGKLMSKLLSGMMKKSMIKAIQEDLDDIKKAVEA